MKKGMFALLFLTVFAGIASPIFGREAAEHELSAQIFYPLTTTETRDDLSHLNIYFLYSRLGAVDGIDLGYGYSRISGNMEGVQWSGGAALVGGDLYGVSVTGLAGAVRGNVDGVQWSGLGNWSSGSVRGVQAAGLANVAGDVQGVQAAGIANVAGDTRGVQASGIVNVAGDVRGVQIGLVNIADRMEGVPLGLINLSRNGGIQISGWSGGVTEVNSGLRFRSGPFYTIFGYGISSGSYDGLGKTFSEARLRSSSFSVGGQIPLGPFYLNLEGGVLAVDSGTAALFSEEQEQLGFQYRAMVELPLFWGVSVFGGLGSQYLTETEYIDEELRFGEESWRDFYVFGAGVEF